MASLLLLLLLVPSIWAAEVSAELFTPIHEPGRCAVRGHCGTLGWFGKPVPCVDNGLAKQPDDPLRQQLVELCGAQWSEGAVCCTAEQVASLKSALSTPNQMISSCPACKDNFYNLFCTFTCSPDQSLFANITKTVEKKGKALVSELDHLVSDDYGTGFYDSCKDVKFGATNARAMDFIGGGAKDYQAMLKFLGDKKDLGSPFQMNFPREYPQPEMAPLPLVSRRCNDDDARYRCVCVDCPDVCLELPAVDKAGSCRVGVLPCLSFWSILTYGVLALGFVLVFFGRPAWNRYRSRRMQARQLLYDSAPGGDADYEDGADADDDEEQARLLRNYDVTLDHKSQQPYLVNSWCDWAFSQAGHVLARFPAITILSSLLVVIVLSAGWVRFEIEKDPARLWVSPNSEAALEKAFFDNNFGPFYRTEKIFLVNDTSGSPGPVLSYNTLVWWMEVEQTVRRLKGPKFGATLQEVCFKPGGDACVVQSVSAYWQSDPLRIHPDSWKQQLLECAASPVMCRPDYGQPIDADMVLGGWGSSDGPDGRDVTEAAALTVTWVVDNAAEGSHRATRAMDWEEALKNRLLSVQGEAEARGLRLSFSTEISLEQELNKSTNTDARIVVISYLVMFAYASMALGSATVSVRDVLRSPSVALVRSKVTLGVVGILIVLMSITASVGLFSWLGVKATLIIAEVIPFIVLAVGVDNIFLIVHEFERINVSHPDDVVEERVSRALGRIGPSILFSAITETVSFGLGALVGMPAVRNFAMYAAGAVLINAMLQVTLFVSVLALNQMRVEDHRADCVPCLQIKSARIHLSGANGHDHGNGYSYGHGNGANDHRNGNGPVTGFRAGAGFGVGGSWEVPEESVLQQFIRRTYAPRLLGRRVKIAVVVVFVTLLAASVALLPGIELGLDQRVAIPDGSYLISYFDDLYAYMGTGPPVYFVTRPFNMTAREGQRAVCSRFTTCQQTSLTNVLEGERKRPALSYLSTPTASWLDDFFLWLNPAAEECCVRPDGTACFDGRDPEWNATLAGMPEGDEFVEYLDRFLLAPATEACPLGGREAYGRAVVLDRERTTVQASHFRTAHVPLRGQRDFIAAYAAARRIASDLSDQSGLAVFPYSSFYVFFDQYLTIVPLTATLLAAAAAVIMVVSWALLGSIATAAVVTGTVAMSVADVMGAMALMGVSLNAVSLVNLVICVGISVEFCAHVARAFAFPARTVLARAPGPGGLPLGATTTTAPHRSGSSRSRDARAWTALVSVGASVFSGITVTKLLGVSVLAFTRSKIFEIYYFRVWLALVLSAAAHALVFLPVALALVGGPGFLDHQPGSRRVHHPAASAAAAAAPGDRPPTLEEDLASRLSGALLPDQDSDSDHLSD